MSGRASWIVLALALGCGPSRGEDPPEQGETTTGSTSTVESSSEASSSGAPNVCGDGIPAPGQPCFRAVSVALPDHDCGMLDIGDVDGDGIVDVVTSLNPGFIGFGDARIDLLHGTPEGLELVTTEPLSVGVTRLRLGDLDGDARGELVLATAYQVSSGDVGWTEYGTAALVPVGVGEWVGIGTPAPSTDFGQLQVIGDFVTGGRNEVVWLGEAGELWAMDDDHAIAPIGAGWLALDGFAHDMAAGELDGAGGLDLVVVTGELVQTYFGAGDGTFVPGGDWVAAAVKVVAGDLDLDGIDELVVAAGWAGDVVVLRNDAGDLAQVDAIPAVDPEDTFGAPGLALADLDVDGLLDLAIADDLGLRIHRGAGDGTFSPALELVGGQVLALATDDLDGDGRADIALCLPEHTLAVLYTDP